MRVSCVACHMFVDVTFDGHVERAIGFLCEDCAAKTADQPAPPVARSERPARRRLRTPPARPVAPEPEPEARASSDLIVIPEPAATRQSNAGTDAQATDIARAKVPARAVTGPRSVAPVARDHQPHTMPPPARLYAPAADAAKQRRATVALAALSALAVLGASTLVMRKPPVAQPSQAIAPRAVEVGTEQSAPLEEPTPAAAVATTTVAAGRTVPAPRSVATARPSAAAASPDAPRDGSLPPPTGVAFDAAAASRSVAQLAAGAARCRDFRDPGGVVKLVLTFAPSGRVTSSRVEGPFAGTTTGSCLATHFRAAAVPPFEGGPTMFTKSVPISGAGRD